MKARKLKLTNMNLKLHLESSREKATSVMRMVTNKKETQAKASEKAGAAVESKSNKKCTHCSKT